MFQQAFEARVSPFFSTRRRLRSVAITPEAARCLPEPEALAELPGVPGAEKQDEDDDSVIWLKQFPEIVLLTRTKPAPPLLSVCVPEMADL
jgi:hypothetical protein